NRRLDESLNRAVPEHPQHVVLCVGTRANVARSELLAKLRLLHSATSASYSASVRNSAVSKTEASATVSLMSQPAPYGSSLTSSGLSTTESFDSAIVPATGA